MLTGGVMELVEDYGGMERELMSRIKDSDDPGAKERLFSMYGGILNGLAYRYSSPLLPHADAYQVAALGLLKALRRFEPGKKAAFRSFACPYIEGELKKFYRDKAELVRLPRRLQRMKREVILFEEDYRKSTGCEPKVSQVAEHLCTDEDDVIEALIAVEHPGLVSLDWSNSDDEIPSLADSLGTVDASFEEVETRIDLSQAIGSLPPRLRRIAELRLKEGWTQRMIAEELGVSQMHVSRLQKVALKRLGELCFAERLSA